MNKIIFEIGLLAFCVSFVIFGTQGNDLLETVSRAFIVFMVVVCALAMMLFLVSLIGAKERPPHGGTTGTPEAMGGGEQNEGPSAQSAA